MKQYFWTCWFLSAWYFSTLLSTTKQLFKKDWSIYEIQFLHSIHNTQLQNTMLIQGYQPE